jgi:hypothetical protein
VHLAIRSSLIASNYLAVHNRQIAIALAIKLRLIASNYLATKNAKCLAII